MKLENQPSDTDRPPPIDFSKLSDSEKLNHLCQMVVHIADHLVVINQNLVVVDAKLGVLDEDGQSVHDRLKCYERVLVEQAHDLEDLRTHVLGKGASIHELQLAEDRRKASSDAPDR